MLGMQHVLAIRDVLAHNNPLQLLFDRASGQESPDAAATIASLNPSALLRLGHHEVVPEDHDIPAVPVRELNAMYQVLRNRPDEGFVELILPGIGVCWTERSQLLELQPLRRRQSHPVRKLSASGIDDGSVPALIELLPLIGEPLEHLFLTDMDGSMTSRVFRTVQASCKNLRHLKIYSAEIDTLDWLIDTEWMLESLCLGVNVVDAASWSRFFSHLGDAGTALALSLHELHLDFSPALYRFYHRTITDDEIITLAVEMLKTNERLVRCEISGCEESACVEHMDVILSHHNKPLGVEKAPLSREAKLAFLSATTPRGSSTNLASDDESKRSKRHRPSARTKLDPHVLSAIMKMAAETERRVVRITTDEFDGVAATMATY